MGRLFLVKLSFVGFDALDDFKFGFVLPHNGFLSSSMGGGDPSPFCAVLALFFSKKSFTAAVIQLLEAPMRIPISIGSRYGSGRSPLKNHSLMNREYDQRFKYDQHSPQGRGRISLSVCPVI